MYSALSILNTTTEVPLSKAPNPQLLPRRRSINGCPLLRVCVHSVCVCVFTDVILHITFTFMLQSESKCFRQVCCVLTGKSSISLFKINTYFINNSAFSHNNLKQTMNRVNNPFPSHRSQPIHHHNGQHLVTSHVRRYI